MSVSYFLKLNIYFVYTRFYLRKKSKNTKVSEIEQYCDQGWGAGAGAGAKL